MLNFSAIGENSNQIAWSLNQNSIKSFVWEMESSSAQIKSKLRFNHDLNQSRLEFVQCTYGYHEIQCRTS